MYQWPSEYLNCIFLQLLEVSSLFLKEVEDKIKLQVYYGTQHSLKHYMFNICVYVCLKYVFMYACV